jgi:selenide,water dikinase
VDTVIRLTQFSHGAGCACKLGPADLSEVLGRLPAAVMPPEVLVAGDTKDDAAVYRLPGGGALVQTIDFFMPVVDDAFDWGRIAAANALSDVYAMGGRPVLALNVVGWPVDRLPLELLSEVLRGGAEVASEAGVAIVGGHTIDDTEPKYGMAVTGFVDEADLTRNSTAPPGATLFLTKPLGVGIATTAIKRGVATEAQTRAAVELMTTLNRDAAEAMLEVRAEAATDVTGFGLVGHLVEMLESSGVSGVIDAGALEFLPGTRELAGDGVVPGGSRRNHQWLSDRVDWGGLEAPEQLMLADAQTSGGLLIATTRPGDLRAALEARGVPALEVGRTEAAGATGAGRVRLEGRVAADAA